ncbi:MAG: transporter substrate-binding domain-containing protein [Cyanobacteria bacterium P01_F01_bin.53]
MTCFSTLLRGVAIGGFAIAGVSFSAAFPRASVAATHSLLAQSADPSVASFAAQTAVAPPAGDQSVGKPFDEKPFTDDRFVRMQALEPGGAEGVVGRAESIKVGTKEIVPFVSLEEDERPYGYSIEFWDKIASDLELETEWVRYDSVADLLAGLANGEVDAAIAGISITSSREAQGFDFSYSFYRSGLQLMVRSPQADPLHAAAANLFNWDIWRPFLLVMATSAGVGALIWAIEHKHNDAFSSDPVNGIGQGLWFSIVTLGTFGYGDVTPVRVPGRIVACLWMGASFFIVADFIASLTVNQLAESAISFQDMRGEAVGVVDGTTGEDYVRSQPVDVVEYGAIEDAVAALEAGKVAAVVHDQPTLKYLENNAPGEFDLVGERLTQESYGIAFREGDSQLQEVVNQEILTLQEQDYLRLLQDKWFGTSEESL